MSQLTCPTCGSSALATDERYFEVRGMWKNRPVRKCLGCGSGLRLRFILGTQVLAPGLWAEMESSWERQFGPSC
jgi:hypothetical protein